VGTIPSEAFTILTESITCSTPIHDGKPPEEAKAVTTPPSPTQTFRVIYNFTGTGDGDGGTALAIDGAGNLYGTTGGGPFGAGTVFKLTPTASGWLYTRLYSFSGPDGSGPNSPLARSAQGGWYGTTGGGGSGDGTLFRLSAPGHVLPNVFANWTERLLYSFTGGSDGAGPQGSIALDASGNIYGAAYGAGANGGGTLYEFTNGGLQLLHSFPAFSGDGAGPLGVIRGAGGLYGLTWYGGTYDSGTAYTSAGGYQLLHSFIPNGEGNPVSLAADPAGNLFVTAIYAIEGCTYYGTASVFELSYPNWNLGTLATFSNYAPVSAWVATDSSGNVYVTTDYVGNFSQGKVLKLSCCWTLTDLYDFTGGSDGSNPTSAPVVDAQGNIYGTTPTGGAYGHGVVWEITP